MSADKQQLGSITRRGGDIEIWGIKIVYASFLIGGACMFETNVFIMIAFLVVISGLTWNRRKNNRRDMRRHMITAEVLRDLLDSDKKPAVVDLRVPLDFLAHTEMIPGAQRISPKEIIANPDLLSRDLDYVLYCTCPGEDSSEVVLAAALKMGFARVKVLSGGLEAWKEKGYPVILYDKPFHLDVQ